MKRPLLLSMCIAAASLGAVCLPGAAVTAPPEHVVAGGAAATALDALSVAGPAADCTAAQKSQRQAALAAYLKKIPAARKAYFKTHRSARQRAAFVKRQRARLAALRAAARCTVPTPTPLPPPSSGPACAPSLSSSSNSTLYNEGTDTSPRFARSTGSVRAVMLFVDTADRPETGDPTPDEGSASDLISSYRDVSYGRLSFTVAPLLKWVRLPRPAAAYTDNPFDGDRYRALLRDAVAAADPEVNFSGVDIVYIVATPLVGSGRGGVAQPIVADGTALTHFAAFSAPAPDRYVMLHETGHVLGLPHVVAGFWDPMAGAGRMDGPLLGWHRYKLHWIDPGQIRCLNGQGTLEDTLAPIDEVGGVKLLVAPTGASTAVVAEFKQNAGGVLVTAIDANATDPGGLVVQTHGTGIEGAALTPGQELTVGNVTVELLALSSTAARVRMTWR